MASNFDRLAGKLASKPGVTDPKGLAAYIGARKYGSSVMSKAAAKGVPAATVARKK
jgi:hypothetical protein